MYQQHLSFRQIVIASVCCARQIPVTCFFYKAPVAVVVNSAYNSMVNHVEVIRINVNWFVVLVNKQEAYPVGNALASPMHWLVVKVVIRKVQQVSFVYFFAFLVNESRKLANAVRVNEEKVNP